MTHGFGRKPPWPEACSYITAHQLLLSCRCGWPKSVRAGLISQMFDNWKCLLGINSFCGPPAQCWLVLHCTRVSLKRHSCNKPAYLVSEGPPLPRSVLQSPLLGSGHTAEPGPPLPQWRHWVSGDSFAGLRGDLLQLYRILLQSAERQLEQIDVSHKRLWPKKDNRDIGVIALMQSNETFTHWEKNKNL